MIDVSSLRPGARYRITHQRSRESIGMFTGSFRASYQAHYGTGVSFLVNGSVRSLPLAFITEVKPVRERVSVNG